MNVERKVIDLVDRFESLPPPVQGGGGGDGGGSMEKRVEKLEGFMVDAASRLARIETKLDAVVTKEELEKSMHGQTWRMVGAMVGIAGLGLAIAKVIF